MLNNSAHQSHSVCVGQHIVFVSVKTDTSQVCKVLTVTVVYCTLAHYFRQAINQASTCQIALLASDVLATSGVCSFR